MMNNKSHKKSPILSLNNQFSEVEVKKVISPKKINSKTPKKYTIKSPKTLQTECQKLRFYNCYKPNNACFYNLGKLQCQHDPKLEEQLKEMLENPKIGLACPPGKYQKNYRGQEYCSSTKISYDLSKTYKYLYVSIGGETRIMMSLGMPISKIYNDLQTKSIIKTIKDYLGLNIVSTISALFTNICTLIIVFYCHKLNTFDIIDEKNTKTYDFYFFKLTKLAYKKLLLSDLIKDYLKKVRKYFKDYFLNQVNNKAYSKLVIFFANQGGKVGGPEEILFRKDLIEFLNNTIKDPTERILKKYLGTNEKLEKKLLYIYFILETLICSASFGLIHLMNLRHSDKKSVYCQVIFATILGFYFHLLKTYSQSLYLVWLSHYYNNFYITIGSYYQ